MNIAILQIQSYGPFLNLTYPMPGMPTPYCPRGTAQSAHLRLGALLIPNKKSLEHPCPLQVDLISDSRAWAIYVMEYHRPNAPFSHVVESCSGVRK